MLHWTFDALAGTVLPGSPSGTVEGGPALVSGPVGQALFFHGVDDRILLSPGDIPHLAGLKTGTIAFWFRFEDVLNRQAILPLVYLGMDEVRERHNLFVIEIGHRMPGNRKLYVTWIRDDRVELCFDSGFNLQPGRWYHFALVVSEAGNTGYLDGQELSGRHYNFGDAGMRRFLADVLSPELFALGYGKTARGKSPRFLYFTGAMDDFRLYSRPLSSEEVAALYRQGAPRLDLAYREVDGVQLKLDLFYPSIGAPPYPVVVFIHGGGWVKGSKEGARRFRDPLLKRGFAFAAIDYRLAPRWKFPAMIEGAICVVRFLRANSGELGIDPDRIAVLGTSAGGHLAALLGTAPERAFPVDCYPEVSARVQAVVSFYGPTDIPRLLADKEAALEGVFGATSADDPLLASASPITWVSPDDPPFLFVHGSEDPVVPLEQSRLLYEELLEAGVPTRFIEVEHAGHGLAPSGGLPSPGWEEVLAAVASFLGSTLGRGS